MSQDPETNSPLSLDTGRIIVVDDEPMVTASITTMLNLESDYMAIPFNSPKKALSCLCDDEPPDVVISDFLMPEMDGITFLQEIRSRFPDTTLILLTGYADKENAIQAINEVGIYRYLEKPWDNEALKLAIRNGVERTRLLSRLNEKIYDLEQAQLDLKEYSGHLEERVTEKTRDLTLALNKLKAVVENTGDAILTLDHEGRIQRVNPTFARWAKRSQNALEGRSLTEFLYFQDGLKVEDMLNFQEQSQLREARMGNITVEVNISPLPGNEGVVLVCRDIMRRKEAERLREDFVSTLTHDLRTPLLAGIQSIGFFLDGTMGDINERQQEMLEMLTQSNQQMLELVNVLLEVYRYEAKQQKLILEPFQLSDLIHHVLLELQALALSKQQELKTDIVEPLPMAFGDKHAIRRVLTNLLANAIHYTPAGGHIFVYASQDERQITLSVQDDGRGIPAKDLAHLFERFAQGTSKHRTTGTGLGLYLSRQIIEAHGGRIWAKSKEGEGSTFSFELLKATIPSVEDISQLNTVLLE
jgi:PAS domain S-box-containing protein